LQQLNISPGNKDSP